MIEDKRTVQKPKMHALNLENRQKLALTGVLDVGSFNESQVKVLTEAGLMEIKGHDLHMSKLNLENTEMTIEGLIISIDYKDKDSSGKESFLAKLFK